MIFLESTSVVHSDLNLFSGGSSVPEFINLDLMSDICLTPEKAVTTNPLDASCLFLCSVNNFHPISDLNYQTKFGAR